MAYDELELDTLGDRKTALFLIMSDTDDTFNFRDLHHVTPSFSICFATRQMMCTAVGFRSMCGACLMSLRTSVRFRSWKS